MKPLILALLVAAAFQPGMVSAQQQAPIPVQLGVTITPDTVTVGERFIAVIRVRAPLGATIEFPHVNDSTFSHSGTETQIIGRPAIQPIDDSTGVTMSAAYRLVAWNIGSQPIGIGDVIVRHNGDSGFVSLANRSVFVRSVLPADTTLHVPKPLRALFGIAPFDWRPLLIAAAVLALIALLWRGWIWYRRRTTLSRDPFSVAQREFIRIESLQLLDSGAPEQHAALMSDAMLEYLRSRVPGIERSHTSSEIISNASTIHAAAPGLGELLWRTDLIKFAGSRAAPDEAERLGASARDVVSAVETLLVDTERRQREQKAA